MWYTNQSSSFVRFITLNSYKTLETDTYFIINVHIVNTVIDVQYCTCISESFNCDNLHHY